LMIDMREVLSKERWAQRVWVLTQAPY